MIINMMNNTSHHALYFLPEGSDIALLLTIVFYAICCPYSKVEESFNLQAIHDLTEFGVLNLQNFDHLQFPGVVPRTFIGPLIVASLSFPFDVILKLIAAPSFYMQIVCRLIVGVLTWLSFFSFKVGIQFRFGRRVAQFSGILCALQFHICFYMSRTLPNTFALCFCLVGFGQWLRGQAMQSILTLAVAMVIFRCDVAVILVPLVLQLLICREIPFFRSLFWGIATVSSGIAVSVLIDSWFWQKILWPEGVVLFFNTVENKSSAWGVMPFHWYFTSALPRSLHVCILWIICGLFGFRYPLGTLMAAEKQNKGLLQVLPSAVWDFLSAGRFFNKTVVYYCFPAVAFVMLYSFLPHKELRFIFPALPLLTLAGAVGLDAVLPPASTQLWYPLNLLSDARIDRKKTDEVEGENAGSSTQQRASTTSVIVSTTVNAVVLLGFIASLGLNSAFLSAAQHNYPGALALERLIHMHIPLLSHRDGLTTEPIFIHIDAAAAMTGITRFLQERIALDGSVRPTALKLNWWTTANPPAQYLNFDRDSFDYSAFYQCMKGREFGSSSSPPPCEEVIDLVYYSKREDETDFSHYDFLITAATPDTFNDGNIGGGTNFVVIEEIKGFKRLRLSAKGFRAELQTELYILMNHSKY